jgi:hypothetical protein
MATTDNEYLALIQADVKEIHDRLLQDYDDVALPTEVTLDGDNYVAVADTITLLRPALTTSQKAVVTNAGSQPFNLFEDGKQVCRLFKKQTWESPLAGKKELTAKCDTGFSSKAAVASYTKHT